MIPALHTLLFFLLSQGEDSVPVPWCRASSILISHTQTCSRVVQGVTTTTTHTRVRKLEYNCYYGVMSLLIVLTLYILLHWCQAIRSHNQILTLMILSVYFPLFSVNSNAQQEIKNICSYYPEVSQNQTARLQVILWCVILNSVLLSRSFIIQSK